MSVASRIDVAASSGVGAALTWTGGLGSNPNNPNDQRLSRPHTSWILGAEMPATWQLAIYFSGVVLAFIVLLASLLALADHPLAGTLAALAAMAFLLYPAASLCGVEIHELTLRRK